MVTQGLLLGAIFLPGLFFLQGYVVWYYFKRFQPTREMFAIHDPEIVGPYLWLFALAMVSASIVALIGFYIL